MKVHIDRTRCQNLGICTSLVPEVFELDDNGVMVLVKPEPDDEIRGSVENAVMACPQEAISLED